MFGVYHHHYSLYIPCATIHIFTAYIEHTSTQIFVRAIHHIHCNIFQFLCKAVEALKKGRGSLYRVNSYSALLLIRLHPDLHHSPLYLSKGTIQSSETIMAIFLNIFIILVPGIGITVSEKLVDI
jgi:hypothetical protein